MELLTRFVLGGAIVCAFSVLASMVKPKSFSGLFAAAPSVALATLALTFMKHPPKYVATEAGSMILASIALLAYSGLVVVLVRHLRWHSLGAATVALALWFGLAFGLWFLIGRSA